MIPTITRDTIRTHLADGSAMTLVEALPFKYFADEHLPGAININVDEIETLAPKVLTDKAAMVVVYCANTACQNSGQAARKLSAMGYTNVHEYVEGKQDWIEAGLQTAGARAAA